jgi:hypothetical protein
MLPPLHSCRQQDSGVHNFIPLNPLFLSNTCSRVDYLSLCCRAVADALKLKFAPPEAALRL